MHTIYKENIQKLVDALRSSKYKQGFAALKYDDCMCVLGVACDISNLGQWEHLTLSDTYCYMTPISSSRTHLPPDVIAYYGFPNDDPRIDYGETTETLSNLNDSGLPFTTIANLLEEQYLC